MSDTLEDDEPEDPEETALSETTNLTDPKSQGKKRYRNKREDQERGSFWRAVLNDKVGRREMWRLISTEGRAFNTEFAFGPVGVPDPMGSWYNLGRQQWALRLYTDLLRLDPDGTRLMHLENDPRFIVAKPMRQPE